MKRYILTTLAIIFIYGAVVAGAKAQTAGSQTMRAHVPFTFTVGQKSLPAGIYTISILNPTSDRPALQIRNEDGTLSAIIQTVNAGSSLADNSKLVFRRYGEQYFFAQVQMAGDLTSLVTAKTNAERATQRSLKRNAERSVVSIEAQRP